MKLCVLMAVYNEEKYIENALNSILRQSSPISVEVIVIDDGSTDRTGEIIERLQSNTDTIRMIRIKNSGVTAARNVSLEALPHDCTHVTFLDGDDEYPDGKLSRDVQIMLDDPTVDLVFGRCRMVHTTSQRLAENFSDLDSVVRGVQLGASIFSRHLIDQAGRFDDVFEQAEDMDFLFRIIENHPKMAFPDTVSIFYRRHENNMTADLPTLRRNIMRALYHHTRRRKSDPSLAGVSNIFDLEQIKTGNFR